MIILIFKKAYCRRVQDRIVSSDWLNCMLYLLLLYCTVSLFLAVTGFGACDVRCLSSMEETTRAAHHYSYVE